MEQRNMIEMLMDMDHGRIALLLGLVGIIGAVLTVVISILSVQWRIQRVAEFDAQLKSQMLEQGLSASEIETVIEAGRKKKTKWGRFKLPERCAHERARS